MRQDALVKHVGVADDDVAMLSHGFARITRGITIVGKDTNAEIRRPEDLTSQTIKLQSVLDRMEAIVVAMHTKSGLLDQIRIRADRRAGEEARVPTFPMNGTVEFPPREEWEEARRRAMLQEAFRTEQKAAATYKRILEMPGLRSEHHDAIEQIAFQEKHSIEELGQMLEQ